MKHEFPTEWYKYFNPNKENEQELIIFLKPEHYPFFIQGKLDKIKLQKLQIFLVCTYDSTEEISFVLDKLEIPAGNSIISGTESSPVELKKIEDYTLGLT